MKLKKIAGFYLYITLIVIIPFPFITLALYIDNNATTNSPYPNMKTEF